MLRISPSVLTEIARENDWLHNRGRLKGTINATKMAAEIGVAKSTVMRAYDQGTTGLLFLERLHDKSGLPLDMILEKVPA